MTPQTVAAPSGITPIMIKAVPSGCVPDTTWGNTTPAQRTDDALAGVRIPVSSEHHPNASVPSKLDEIHAARVAALPIRNEQGHYEEADPGTLRSAAEVHGFIRDRSAAWKEHMQRQHERRKHRK